MKNGSKIAYKNRFFLPAAQTQFNSMNDSCDKLSAVGLTWPGDLALEKKKSFSQQMIESMAFACSLETTEMFFQ